MSKDNVQLHHNILKFSIVEDMTLHMQDSTILHLLQLTSGFLLKLLELFNHEHDLNICIHNEKKTKKKKGGQPEAQCQIMHPTLGLSVTHLVLKRRAKFGGADTVALQMDL